MIGRKNIIYTLSIFAIICSICTLGLSFYTVSDSNERFVFIKGSCDTSTRPFRVEAKGEDGYIECSWSGLRSGIRIVYLVLFLISSILFFFSIKKKSTKHFLASILAMGIVGIIGFYSFIADAKASANGYSDCKDYFELYGYEKVCNSSRFFGVSALNILTAISIIALSILSLFSRTKLFDINNSKGQQLE